MRNDLCRKTYVVEYVPTPDNSKTYKDKATGQIYCSQNVQSRAHQV